METNYFVCTLGQASVLNVDNKPYRTITQFLAYQSRSCGSKFAVGFPLPRNQDEWDYKLLTFADVFTGTQAFAKRLLKSFDPGVRQPQTVALMAHSSLEFLLTWLGLMYLGHSVLLLAPQCQPAAIVHLCKECNVRSFFYDAAHYQRATEADKLLQQGNSTNFSTFQIPVTQEEDMFQFIQESLQDSTPAFNVRESAVAYLHHTSGTSSGLPKPIPQTHRSAIGVLPHLPGLSPKATFTTTPLYHGGIADTFRSWTSDSPIWLFPGKDVPITARNIYKCLEVATACATDVQSPPVKYFSSVPYVLQMMQADGTGLGMLKNMDIVGVGGAALPVEVGDRLVRNNVNLISRFGSAECGFLLSSYRDFEKDNDWQYLRNYNPAKLLNFEPSDDGLAELIVKSGWPHMAKTNREDCSFATADLFERHANIENAWFYHSRADSQLTLITGKKFDPAPLEAAIATAEELDDVLIFGDNRPYPGALLLRSKKAHSTSDTELLEKVWPHIDELNKESQDHTRIQRHMLVPVSYQDAPLEKSSKGTIIRKTAEARFASFITAAYDLKEDGNGQCIKDEDLPHYLATLIRSITESPTLPAQGVDLFTYGVDSIACMRLRSRLRHLLPTSAQDLPLNVVEDCGTVHELSKYVIRKRHGEADVDVEDEMQLMLELVKEYGDFSDYTSQPRKETTNAASTQKESDDVVLLTGATGALGAHTLHLLRTSQTVSTIYCPVRATDSFTAHSRVSYALAQRGLPPLSPTDKKIKAFAADLSHPHLGLPSALYDRLSSEVTHILHVAWTVNFRLSLRSFTPNLAGLRHLFFLALSSTLPVPPRFVYCSSTAAVMYSPHSCIPESLLPDPEAASPLGYARSKWVAEHILLSAATSTRLQNRISVIRVGQLSGDSQRGVWSVNEAWPLMLGTADLVGCLPDLEDEVVDWLPVDVAAGAFLQGLGWAGDGEDGSMGEGLNGGKLHREHGAQNYEDGVQVLHILNPHATPSFRTLLSWLQSSSSSSPSFAIVPPATWLHKLESHSSSSHPAMKLLGLWKNAYGGEREKKDEGKGKGKARFAVEKTSKAVGVMRGVGPVDEVYVGKIWGWVRANVR